MIQKTKRYDLIRLFLTIIFIIVLTLVYSYQTDKQNHKDIGHRLNSHSEKIIADLTTSFQTHMNFEEFEKILKRQANNEYFGVEIYSSSILPNQRPKLLYSSIPTSDIKNTGIAKRHSFYADSFLDGQKKQIVLIPYNGFVSNFEIYKPVIIIISGFIIALILFQALWSLGNAKIYAELIARERTSDLIENEKRLKLIFDNAGDGIIDLDLNGKIVFANKAALNILKLSKENLLERKIYSLNNDFFNYDDIHNHVLSAGGSIQKEGKLNINKNLDIFIEASFTPAHDENNILTGAVVVFRNITERKMAENALKEANAELEEFAYRTSHDLRAPITSSIGLLKRTEKFISDHKFDKAYSSLDMATKSLSKLETLVKDILVLTRNNKEEEDDKTFDPNVLIHEALEKLSYMDHFERLNIQLHLDFNKKLLVKQNRFTLIVENLISNAIKYQDLETGTPQITITTREDKLSFIFTVEDNGLGIPSDQHENLFTMFKRFHPKTSFGSGLGLYMIKKSADIICGIIKYTPLQKGSSFSLTLPLNKEGA